VPIRASLCGIESVSRRPGDLIFSPAAQDGLRAPEPITLRFAVMKHALRLASYLLFPSLPPAEARPLLRQPATLIPRAEWTALPSSESTVRV